MASRRPDPEGGSVSGAGAEEHPGGDSRAEEDLSAALLHYSPKVIRIWETRRNHGALPQPEGRGAAESDCGDRIEVHLRARDGRVQDASFVSEGCGATFAAGSAAAELARGRTVPGLLAITAVDVLEELEGLPEHNQHCADLAVSALQRAARDLLVTRNEPWKRLYRQ